MNDWTRVLPAERLAEGKLIKTFHGVRRILLVRHGSHISAFPDRCPHAGAPLSSGTFAGQTLTCPRHGWAFDTRSGACPAHPEYALRLLDVREVEGWVEVRDTEIF